MRAWMWALIAGFEVAAATARAGTDGLDLLREVVEQNPADSELAWLWTEELENAGRTAEADQTLSKFVDRFGSQRPGAMRSRPPPNRRRSTAWRTSIAVWPYADCNAIAVRNEHCASPHASNPASSPRSS